MLYRRAVGMAIVVYVATFILGAAAGALMGFEGTEADLSSIPPAMWYASAILAVALSAFATFWYFRSPKTRPSMKNGLLLGVVMIAVGFVLDVIAFLPLAARGKNPLAELGAYYSQPIFWTSLALLLVVTTVMGAILERRRAA